MAIIQSRIIHAFGPILLSAAKEVFRWKDGAFMVFPHPEGALCVATDGQTLAMMLDREAAVASPRAFHLPEALIKACAPRAPISSIYADEQADLPLPEWSQPAALQLTHACASVLPAMHHPKDAEWKPRGFHLLGRMGREDGGVQRVTDYQVFTPTKDPRVILPTIVPGATRLSMDPALVSNFSLIKEVFGETGCMTFTGGTDHSPIMVLLERCPDFFGAISPMRLSQETEWPEFAKALRDEVSAERAKSADAERRTEVAEGRP
ncbi:hypothetical protein [Aureimonas ureilytica]|uniref:hypothetical protein n=1 Tax=Aureimonas ureilytica TaxID=401562 RepID=UPI00128FB73A|nr:hypothetical protein [Aureimonas ureilytica]